MKLLVFAHTPPPHHGQSYMVQLMLDVFSTSEIRCYHVNARFSDSMEDIGGFRLGKVWRLFGFCAQAVWQRVRHGVRDLYYIPAPGKRNAIYRDWLVLALCRPFFPRLILHWHAYGLGEWVERRASPWEAWVTRRLYSRADLSIVLTEFNRGDAAKLNPMRIEVVPNGIPDPCPDFEDIVLPKRMKRWKARQSQEAPPTFQILFLAHCTREKGLFETLEAVALAHAELQASGSLLGIRLIVAGKFMAPAEREEFEARICQPDLAIGNLGTEARASVVSYVGFVSGQQKDQLLRDSDCLCFPTTYSGETFGLVNVEAHAYGLPLVITRWRGLPDIVSRDGVAIIEPGATADLKQALLNTISKNVFVALRSHYMERFSHHAFRFCLRKAFFF
ncbi:MAG TPA: glycosyltransferase family 4 protein [Chthoniobacterales bacterium]|jgi:glycosyltransferase involved in cell wall biosynthesis